MIGQRLPKGHDKKFKTCLLIALWRPAEAVETLAATDEEMSKHYGLGDFVGRMIGEIREQITQAETQGKCF